MFQIFNARPLVVLFGEIGGQQINNFAAINHQSMVFPGYGFRLNRYNPAGMNEGIDYHELFLYVVGLALA